MWLKALANTSLLKQSPKIKGLLSQVKNFDFTLKSDLKVLFKKKTKQNTSLLVVFTWV